MKIFELFTAFFCLISKTNLSIMSIKPSVVYIKGVHSITGPDKTSDIGFPQLELEKLFDGAMIVETADTTYDSSKQYIYYDSNSQTVIQDESHFNCIKNGYYSIADGINHYYTKSGNNYNYNAVPDTSTWAGKWSFSNTIKSKDLYSIDQEAERICVNGNYYKKNGNSYVKQTQEVYDLYEDNVSVDWSDSYKYEWRLIIARDENNNILRDENNNIIRKTVWQNNNGSLATSGYYLSVSTIENEAQYRIELLNIAFNDDGTTEADNLDGVILYKLDIDNPNNLYIKKGNNLDELIVNNGGIILTFDPVNNINYIYHKFSSYSYPNTEKSETAAIYTDSHNNWFEYDANSFPVYNSASSTIINIIEKPSYTIYEKTAVKINYNYSSNANSLKFIFTDKDIDGVLEACNLPNDIKKYVHLTNLRYNNE